MTAAGPVRAHPPVRQHPPVCPLPTPPTFFPPHGSLMNIFANTVVTLTFELFDADGVLLE